MARVIFTPNLRRHVDCPDSEAPGDTVRDVLDRVFDGNPQLRGYVLDEQGRLRKHMGVIVDGAAIADREKLSDPVGANGRIYVLQALSGG